MAPSLSELVAAVSRQWAHREGPTTQLAALLHPETPSPSSIAVYGPAGSGKSSVINELLRAFDGDGGEDSASGRRKRKRVEMEEDEAEEEEVGQRSGPARDDHGLPHTTIRAVECVTARQMLLAMLNRTVEAMVTFRLRRARQREGMKRTKGSARDGNANIDTNDDEWETEMYATKCEHISQLPGALERVLDGAGCGRFVLVLDGADALREGGPMLVAGLVRVAQMIPALTMLFVLKHSPRPFFFQAVGVPYVYFPPYTRAQAVDIISRTTRPLLPVQETASLDVQTISDLYPQFITLVHDVLIAPTASPLRTFRSVAAALWPRFIEPLVRGERAPGGGDWDFARLFIRGRALFSHAAEPLLTHSLLAPATSDSGGSGGAGPDLTKHHNQPLVTPTLPYMPTLILTAAFLAAHVPPRLDVIFFSKFASSSLSARNKRAHHRRRLNALSQAQEQEPGRVRGGDADLDGGDKDEADDDLDIADDDDDYGRPAPALAAAAAAGASGSGRQRPRKRKRTRTKITRSTFSSALTAGSSTAASIPGGTGFIHARPFPLERLLAIYHAIDPDPTLAPSTGGGSSAGGSVAGQRHAPVADEVFAQLATLQRLRLVVPVGSGSGEGGAGGGGGGAGAGGEKWYLNVYAGGGGDGGGSTAEWIVEMARGIGVEVGEYIAGGLD